jgi:hypothetical protein
VESDCGISALSRVAEVFHWSILALALKILV